MPDLIRPEHQVAAKQNFQSMIEKEFSDHEDEDDELFQIKTNGKDEENSEEEEEEEEEEENIE